MEPESTNHGKSATFSVLLSTFSLFFAIFLVKYLWSRRYLYYVSWKMHGPFAWPLIGNGLLFAGGTEDILDNIMHLFRTYKSPMRCWLGNRLFFTIAQPKDLEVILNSPHALHKEALYQFTRPVVGTGLFTADVAKWKRHRKVILPTFNQKILNSFVEVFAEHSEILVKILEAEAGKGMFDMFPILSKCTLDIICETAMGKKIHAQTSDTDFVKWVARAMEIVYMRMFQTWFHWEFIWRLSPLSSELDFVADQAVQFIRQILLVKKQEYRQRRNGFAIEAPRQRKAFLDYLIELSEETENWTDEEIIEEAATVAVAGSDSTGSMDSFALMMIGMHPEVQVKVHEELDSIFGSSTRSVTPEDLPRMVYLERVIKETLRLFPVGPVIVRALHDDVQLESHTLPKGGSCVIGIIHTHRDPELWPEPLKFDPDRFLPEEVAKRHPYAYIPFSGGPRNCIGPKYAMMAIKSVLSTVLRHYTISTDFKSVADIKVKADLMIKCVGGYRMAIEKRSV